MLVLIFEKKNARVQKPAEGTGEELVPPKCLRRLAIHGAKIILPWYILLDHFTTRLSIKNRYDTF